jgi:hypothetical protein
MINYLGIFTPRHFSFMFLSFKVVFIHLIFIYNMSTLTNDMVIRL